MTPESVRVLGYLPAGEKLSSPDVYEDNPAGKQGTPDQLDASGVQLPEHRTWFFLPSTYLQSLLLSRVPRPQMKCCLAERSIWRYKGSL